MSQLFVPGPRNNVRAAFPTVPTAGIWNTEVSKNRLKVRSLFGSAGFPATTARTVASVGDPVKSTDVVVATVTPVGAPLMKLAMPETCQSLNAVFNTGLRKGLFGTS